MSNRLYQTVIEQMKDVLDCTIGVLDKNGVVIACSDEKQIGEVRGSAIDVSTSEFSTVDGFTYYVNDLTDKLGAIIFVEGEDASAMKTAQLIGISLANMKALYDEKYDKNSFIKNIMLDNILPSDIYAKGKEMNFENDVQHIVMAVKFLSQTDVLPLEIVQSIFADTTGVYVVSVGDSDIVVVKQTKRGEEATDYEPLAENIVETVSTEFFAKVAVGISSISEGLKSLASAYKEARISLEVRKVFDLEKNILCYENLGIGRLIYQLPTTLCDVFLQEVFKKGSLESLDQDTLMTVQAFFKNNLNVSETSRALFVHRNTLVYRLEKIRKITGLDLRKFEHAVTFKVALMVKKYLANKPVKF